MIIFQKHDSLQNLVQQNKDKHTNNTKKVQPYVVYCGPLRNITCCHVVLHTTIYDFDCSMKAVDFLYKLMHVLDIDYPIACPHVWAYMQNYIYCMPKVRKITK